MTLATLLLVAQTVTAVIAPSTPFVVSWRGDPADKFRWWCGGEIKKNFAATEIIKSDVGADGLTKMEATVPGLAAGTHSCLVSAFNDLTEAQQGFGEAKSVAVPIVVGKLPTTPLNLRVVVKIGGL